jgi:hypothetical protein
LGHGQGDQGTDPDWVQSSLINRLIGANFFSNSWIEAKDMDSPSEQVLLPLGLGFAFLLAWLGSLAGLATIVGA